MQTNLYVFSFLLALTITASSSARASEAESKSPPVDVTDWSSVRAYALKKMEAGKYKAAEKYLAIARSLAEKTSTDCDRYLSTIGDMAKLHEERGKYWQAYREYDQLHTSLSEKPHKATVTQMAGILDDCGRVSALLGDLPQARMQLERSLEALNKSDDQSLLKAKTLRDLAAVHSQFGLYGRAQRDARQAFELSNKLAGAKSLDTCESLIALANSAMFASQPEKAESYIREAMAIPVQNDRKTSLARANCLDTCAQIYLDEGLTEKALPVEQEAAGIRENICGKDHPLTGDSLMTLAIISIAQKDYAAAKLYLERAMPIAQDRFGAGSAKVAKVLILQGTCAKAEGSSDKASASFTKSAEISQKLPVLDNPEVKTLRDIAASSSETKKNFWEGGQFNKADAVVVDPLSRCVICLNTKGVIDRPAEAPDPEMPPLVDNKKPPAAAPQPAVAPDKGDAQKNLKIETDKLRFDPKALWFFGLLLVPIAVLVVFNIVSTIIRSLGAPATREVRRGPPPKGEKQAAVEPDKPDTKGQSGSLMGGQVDEKVNKFWDINH